MAEIVITEFMDEPAVERLRAAHNTLYDPKLVDSPHALIREAAGARALIVRNRTQMRGALLDAAAALICVGRLGVGLDNIDVDACRARGVAVIPATGANDESVAEYVIAAAMILLRGAVFASDAVRAGDWPRQRLMGREIAGRTFGAVGFGSIGAATARRAAALGMRCVAFDPRFADGAAPSAGVEPMALDALLAAADVVSLHVPLTDHTRRMIDAVALARMKPDAILINAARGGVVDEAALAAALKSGRLGGAALDVFNTEPLTAEAGAVFADCPNLILTPHIAGVTTDSNRRVSHLIADKVLEALGG
ncbi:MAG: hydroxyacid dehydrogenase [Pseudomonadota bacterium]